MPMTASPSYRAEINLSNWRSTPYSAWTFQNAAELVPTAIVRGSRKTETGPVGLGKLANLTISQAGKPPRSLISYLESSNTDNLVVLRKGKIVAEWNAPTCNPERPHMVFSVSKSITSLLAGILVDKGKLSVSDQIVRHVPEAAGSAYDGATVQHLLDMQISIDFDEAYLNRDGAFDRYRRAMLWNPERPDEATPNLDSFLATLPRAQHPHGTIHNYRSPNTDMMAIVLERASGERFADMLSAYLWQPMGAHTDAQVTIDRAGNPRASGGISMTARDMARVGELVRSGGRGVVPAGWIEQLWAGGSQAIWAAGDQGHTLPDGSYRNYWYKSGTGELAASGIHGQWLWIDREQETVVARQACEADPINDEKDIVTIAVMSAICAAS